jgi:phage tail tape-measure protein
MKPSTHQEPRTNRASRAGVDAETEKLEAELHKKPHSTAAGAAGGAAAGAALGAIAGPPGAVVGAVIGAAAGAAAGYAVEQGDAERADEDAKLDEEIGVTAGDLGAPNLEHPPARVGAYSTGSSGAEDERTDVAPSEGPMPGVESDD